MAPKMANPLDSDQVSTLFFSNIILTFCFSPMLCRHVSPIKFPNLQILSSSFTRAGTCVQGLGTLSQWITPYFVIHRFFKLTYKSGCEVKNFVINSFT